MTCAINVESVQKHVDVQKKLQYLFTTTSSSRSAWSQSVTVMTKSADIA